MILKTTTEKLYHISFNERDFWKLVGILDSARQHMTQCQNDMVFSDELAMVQEIQDWVNKESLEILAGENG